MLDMLTVPGLRPDKVSRLYRELGITSLAALEEALAGAVRSRELFLPSPVPVNARSLLAARAFSIAIDALASVALFWHHSPASQRPPRDKVDRVRQNWRHVSPTPYPRWGVSTVGAPPMRACGRGALGDRPKPVTGADDLAVLRRIDELHLELPFYGSRRMTFELDKEGRGVNRKRVQRLMRVMGIEALVPRPGTSQAAPGHKIYPYLSARPEDCRAEPRVGGRRDLHHDGVLFPLPGGDHRLGEPGGSGMAAVEHQRCELLRGGAGGGAASVRKAADFQWPRRGSWRHFRRTKAIT